MTYPKEIPAEELEHLAPILDQIQELAPGESVLVADESAPIDRLRGRLYAWFSINRLTPLYTIRREGPERLRVIRKTLSKPTVLESSASVAERFVQEHLVDIEDEDEALSIIRSAREQNELHPSEAFKAFEEWKKWSR